jgi:branched-chain amino acid transport system ATP-binding protein
VKNTPEAGVNNTLEAGVNNTLEAGVDTTLEARDVVKTFGGVRALDKVSIAVGAASIHGVIGPNGSGKTTLLGVLAGTHRPDHGQVLVAGNRVPGRGAHRFVRAGVARTFQTTRLFGERSLLENLRVGAAESAASQPASLERILQITELADRDGATARNLTNAEQRRAMVATALSTGPRTLLLDEPAVGMSSAESDLLARVLAAIRDELGVAIVVVEHNMHFMMTLAEKITVVSAGRVLAEGSPAEIRANSEVISSYLGS